MPFSSLLKNLFPAAPWSLSNRGTVFSKAMTIFDLSSNQYSEVVSTRKRPPLLNRRVDYTGSGSLGLAANAQDKIMGVNRRLVAGREVRM